MRTLYDGWEMVSVIRRDVVLQIDGPEVQLLIDVCELARRRLTVGTDLESKDADFTELRKQEIKNFARVVFDSV